MKDNEHLVHVALICAQIVFGLGSIIGALGLPATNPLAFTFVREITAGCILLFLSFLVERTKSRYSDEYYLLVPRLPHQKSFFILGFCLFVNQAGYICGLLLAGPVMGAIWQPSTPIFTAAISMLLGLEPKSALRVTGVLISFLGCAAMIFISDHDQQQYKKTASEEAGPETSWFLLGNALFFFNCLATACYILASKDLLTTYPPLTVTAWSYLLAMPHMFLAAYLSSIIPKAQEIICPLCVDSPVSIFQIPSEALPALAYFTVAMSVGSWGCLLWANQFATGTLVVGYSVLQPITSLVFASIVLFFGLATSCKQVMFQENASHHHEPCLNEPGIGTLAGMLGVFMGLSIIIQTEPKPNGQQEQSPLKGSDLGYGTIPSSESNNSIAIMPQSPLLM